MLDFCGRHNITCDIEMVGAAHAVHCTQVEACERAAIDSATQWDALIDGSNPSAFLSRNLVPPHPSNPVRPRDVSLIRLAPRISTGPTSAPWRPMSSTAL
jgi:hypothetical protein